MSYVDRVIERLVEAKFDIRRGIEIGEFTLDLTATTGPQDVPPKGTLVSGGRGIDMALGKEPYILACSILATDTTSIDLVEKYSQTLYQYFFDESSGNPLGKHLSRVVFPIIISQSFRDDLKSFVTTYNPKHFSLPVWHIEHPVLASLDSKQLYHYDKVTFMGYRLKKIAVKAVQTYFSF